MIRLTTPYARWVLGLAASAGLFLPLAASAGNFAPASDQPGATGISAESAEMVGWAAGIVAFQRGLADISQPDGASATHGVPEDALDRANASYLDPDPVVSLGDGGWITLSFDRPITNGPGADFAVFENGFAADSQGGKYFLELAFVEVSSNGVNFFRFPSISLTPATSQTPGYAFLDPTDIYNLAGKEISGYGVPFDLQELASLAGPELDLARITQVRVVDVVGSIQPAYARYDSLGHVINDPWKTNSDVGGFDLDAVGVLHQVPEPGAAGLILASAGALALRRQRRGGTS